MTSLSIRLEARSAAHRCYRAYVIDVGTDLFGAWLVDMSYGRTGTIGRSKIRSFATIEDLRTRCALACENARQHRAALAPLTTCVASIETKAGGNRGSTIDFAGGFRRQPTQLRAVT